MNGKNALPSNTYLELRDISKTYASQTVLHETNLSIKQGEFVCCLGPSGCGKSTMLNAIAGIISPSSGKILLQNKDITFLPPEKRKCGVVFQSYALFPNLTVAQNIAYGLRGKEWNKKTIDERVAEMLTLMNLDAYNKKYPCNLSGGEQQRVALARALAPRPALLLLDEPLSALDAKIRVRLGEELRRLQRQIGITTIMVTHDQQEALDLANRIVVMNQGNVEQIGTPEEIYQSPKTKFVAQFVGNMNFIIPPSSQDKKEIAIRYEDVVLNYLTEFRLQEKDTFVARIEEIRYLGNIIRVRLLLQDYVTELYADCIRSDKDLYTLNNLVSVTLPRASWQSWDK